MGHGYRRKENGLTCRERFESNRATQKKFVIEEKKSIVAKNERF